MPAGRMPQVGSDAVINGVSLLVELISEVVEIEKAQVTERAYPPGITNRR